MDFKARAVLGLAIGAMVLAGLVDFTLGILSRMVDFAFVGVAIFFIWTYVKMKSIGGSSVSPQALQAEKDRRIEVEQQNAQLKREIALLRDWTGRNTIREVS